MIWAGRHQGRERKGEDTGMGRAIQWMVGQQCEHEGYGWEGQGDLIPWTVGQQYQDAEFPALSGARIVRIAVHPDLPRSGYGSRALAILRAYYQVHSSNLECGQARSVLHVCAGQVLTLDRLGLSCTTYDPS